MTWDFLVYNVDSPVHQTEASLLNPPGHCHSGPALPDSSLGELDSWLKLRTEDRTSQLPSDMLQTLSLKNYEDENKMKKKVILVFKCIHVAVRFNRFNNILHWHSYWFVLTTQKCVSTLWFRLKYYKCKAKMTHRWN